MNQFLVKIQTESGQVRNEVFKTKTPAILKSKLERVLLKAGERIQSVEYFNAIDDIDVLSGKKHIITFMDAVIFASESILEGEEGVGAINTCINYRNLIRKAKNEFYDASNGVTIKMNKIMM